MSRERVARILARERADARADRMLARLRDRDSEALAHLQTDAITELRIWTDLQIVPLDAAPDSTCAIAGVYIDDVTPPRIGVVKSGSRARDNFTALHELGHHLQATDDELIDELGAQPDRGRRLEEDSADRFAAGVLIPAALRTEVLGPGTPTTSQVVSLWKRASGSRAAVCVAAAQQLGSPGHVLLLDGDGAVNFCATRGEFRLARGSDQSSTEIWRAFQRTRRSTAQAKTRLVYREGIQGGELYAEATSIDGYTVVVAVTDGAPWERLALSSTSEAVVGGWHTCLVCAETFRSFELCERSCGSYPCPNGHCACQHQLAERQCIECFLSKHVQLFDGNSAVCRDCSG